VDAEPPEQGWVLGYRRPLQQLPEDLIPKLVTALLVKDEKDKYLERVLCRCWEFSDEVHVLDDGSTDGSDRLAVDLGCELHRRTDTGMWGNEAPARAELWDIGAQAAGDGWLLICDADMLLHGDPRPFLYTTVHNAWAFVLFDTWGDERYYRKDGFWRGHEFPRPWLFRPSAMGITTPEWPARGIHTGHCPTNAVVRAGVADFQSLYWIHLAYTRKEHRIQKVQKYLGQAHQLSDFEKAHAESVGD
jgi:hypothetical protein